MTTKPKPAYNSFHEAFQKKEALRIMKDCFYCNPHSSYTTLAEYTAIDLGHDEWLDNPEHWIWDMALSVGDHS